MSPGKISFDAISPLLLQGGNKLMSSCVGRRACWVDLPTERQELVLRGRPDRWIGKGWSRLGGHLRGVEHLDAGADVDAGGEEKWGESLPETQAGIGRL